MGSGGGGKGGGEGPYSHTTHTLQVECKAVPAGFGLMSAVRHSE